MSRGGRGSNPITDWVVTSFRRGHKTEIWSSAGSSALSSFSWSQLRLDLSARRQGQLMPEMAVSVLRNFRSGWNSLSQRTVRGNM